jgi:ketosteroid isomerase-like protein
MTVRLSRERMRATYPLSVSNRTERLAGAFAALSGGDVSGFRDLFLPDAQWLGVPGSGWEGETPT